MRVLYFDMTAGISGDMTLGALADLGVPMDLIREWVDDLQIEHVDIVERPVQQSGLQAVKIDVRPAEPGPVRTFANIRSIIENSDLKDTVKARSLLIFQTLAEAEGKIHGKQPDQVHFHEIGAADSIVDIVGTALGLDWLGADEIHASPVPLGTGMVKTKHGVLPVPVPAVVEILRGVPVYSSGIPTEIVTPTGAAILKACVDQFGPLPPMELEAVGYGAGYKDLGIPNLLRILVGTAMTEVNVRERALLITTNIDDMNPELYEYVMEKLFAAGASDVWLAPIQMKKTRPATSLHVLVPPAQVEKVKEIIFEETNTLGLRVSEVEKESLERDFLQVDTGYGEVRVKVGRRGERVVNLAPENADCQKVARESGVPLKEIYDLAIAGARHLLGEREEPGPEQAG